jgi:tetratricopeptide (TPR) repeat protein
MVERMITLHLQDSANEKEGINSMMLQASPTKSTGNISSDLNERVLSLCSQAKIYEDLGEFELGREELQELWQGPPADPATEGLEPAAQAELTLRAGTLTGWIGDADQIKDLQERAKNLISRAREIFKSLDDKLKVAESESELGYCYWRTGDFEEARILLQEAHNKLDESQPALLGLVKLRQAIVEYYSHHYETALEIMSEAMPLFESSGDDCLRGKGHVNLAIFLDGAGAARKRPDLADKALIEYAAAAHYFEVAGHRRYRAAVVSNLGYLYFTIQDYPRALEQLTTARRLFKSLGDVLRTAQTEETLARTYLAQSQHEPAARMAKQAVQSLRKGDSPALLSEALTTNGRAVARQGNILNAKVMINAKAMFKEAVEVAERINNKETAARAWLAFIEELHPHLSLTETREAYDQAEAMLTASTHEETLSRLASAARLVIAVTRREEQKITFQHNFLIPPEPDKYFDWTGFSLAKQVAKYERPWILRALRDANYMVSHASKLLGFDHHNSLASILDSRHPEIKRKPVVKRRRRNYKIRH